MKRIVFVTVLLASLLLGAVGAFADQEFNKGSSLSGGDFKILDPQHGGFGGTSSSSSSSFRLLGTIGDVAIGSSSNAGGFGLRSGFLYFPFILQPTLTSATPGNGQVSLVWIDGAAGGGLTITGYNVCTKPTAGSYTCEDVGDVNAFVKTGLTNGTSYTFRIDAYHAYAPGDDVIAQSNELSATPVAPPTPTPPGGGGGGGSIPSPSPSGGPGGTTLEMSGIAYPHAPVHILRDGVQIGQTVADASARWFISISGQPPGQHTVGVWASDMDGRRSVTLAFVVNLSTAAPTRIIGIIVPPTIEVVDTEVDVGAPISIRGSSAPGATVRIVLEPGGREVTVTAAGIGNGRYSAQMPTTGLSAGVYTVKARTELPPGADRSTWSQLVRVGIGVPLPPENACGHPPDINGDGRVNLVDFSIMAFWWNKPLPPDSPVDLNCDGRLTLADFSILAFHWSGR